MINETYIVKAQFGEDLDKIFFLIYGKNSDAWVTFMRANPGIADYGDIIPKGTIINIPKVEKAKTRSNTKLWD